MWFFTIRYQAKFSPAIKRRQPNGLGMSIVGFCRPSARFRPASPSGQDKGWNSGAIACCWMVRQGGPRFCLMGGAGVGCQYE